MERRQARDRGKKNKNKTVSDWRNNKGGRRKLDKRERVCEGKEESNLQRYESWNERICEKRRWDGEKRKIVHKKYKKMNGKR